MRPVTWQDKKESWNMASSPSDAIVAASAVTKSSQTPDKVNAEQRESNVKLGLAFLAQLEQALVAAGSSGHLEWILRQIRELHNTIQVTPTIIGVFGNTGAGKSSVINAVLGEERYVHPISVPRVCN